MHAHGPAAVHALQAAQRPPPIQAACRCTTSPPNRYRPRDVRLSRADQLDSAVTIHGSDDDGWIRLSVALAMLTVGAGLAKGAGDSYDRIVMRDISGERPARLLLSQGAEFWALGAGPARMA